jgi:hypothetical protein
LQKQNSNALQKEARHGRFGSPVDVAPITRSDEVALPYPLGLLPEEALNILFSAPSWVSEKLF